MPNKTITFEPREILCPIDFSELSDLALKYAAAGARQFNANLTVFHAAHIEVPRYITPGVADQITEEISTVQKDFQTYMARHVQSVLGSATENLSLRYKFLQSHPVDGILETANTGGNDLIVLGTRGFSGMKRLLMGSVATGVLESANIPLFIVRQKQHEFIDTTKQGSVPQIKNILCPCNIEAPAVQGLRYAVSLCEQFHADLTVLTISEEEKQDVSAVKEKLGNWISDNTQAKFVVNPVVRHGNSAEQIIDYARENKSDLIVLSARHHSFQGGTFFGRTTDLVVRHAPMPVLTVPAL